MSVAKGSLLSNTKFFSSYFSCLQKSLLEEALHYISEHKSLDNRILDGGVPDSNYMSFYLCMIFCYELMLT